MHPACNPENLKTKDTIVISLVICCELHFCFKNIWLSKLFLSVLLHKIIQSIFNYMQASN